MKDATCYLVWLLEHRSRDGTVDSHWGLDAKRLMVAIGRYFANKQNVRCCGNPYCCCCCRDFVLLDMVREKLGNVIYNIELEVCT